VVLFRHGCSPVGSNLESLIIFSEPRTVHLQPVLCEQHTPFSLTVVPVIFAGRTLHVRLSSDKSSTVHLVCGVPQRSVIGPSLFILYSADLIALVESLRLSPHLCADDTQIFMALVHRHTSTCSWRQSPTASTLSLTGCSPTACNSTITRWEFIWRTMDRRQHHLPTVGPTIGSFSATPPSVVHDLGIYIDSDLSMCSRVTLLCSCISCVPSGVKYQLPCLSQ